MPSEIDFQINKCIDCFRVTRIDTDGNLHTHCKSLKIAKVIIQNVCNEKIPLHSRSRTLESMKRLSTNKEYIRKIDELLKTRIQKGKKQSYFNPGIKKSF